MVQLSELREVFNGTIRLNEPLAKFTALRVGGPADYLLESTSHEAISAAVDYFRTNAFPYLFLQPKTLVSDRGFRGAVLLTPHSFDPVFVEKRCAPMFKPLPHGSVADLIEKAGLNGLTWGGAAVLADCVVNADHASAADILSLIKYVQRQVQTKLGVALEIDLELVGFDDEALAHVA